MTLRIAFLRAVNLGGQSTLPMADLRRVAGEAGFAAPRTCRASGNLLFADAGSEDAAKARLEAALLRHMGRPCPVVLRTRDDLEALLARTPFPDAPPARTLAILLDAPPPPDAAVAARNRGREEIALGAREVWVHYPDGIGRSRLRLPVAATGTARNVNTLAAVARMAAD